MRSKISNSLLYAVKTLSDEKVKAVAYVRNFRELCALKRFGIVREYPFIGAVGLEFAPNELCAIASLPTVEYVTSCAKVSAFAENLEGVSNLLTDSKYSGRGVRLCIMDTGVSPHLDFCMPESRLVEFKDTTSDRKAFYDDNGHGTFVAGVAAGNGLTSGLTYKGVATSAEIIAVKVIGADGEGGAFGVLDGMQWLLDNKSRLDVKVCCMSFGSTPTDVNDPLKRGAEVLVRNGITVIAASGNGGENTLKSPAVSAEVISVGAVDGKGAVADFTSRGIIGGRKKPDIYAQGVNVVSTLSGACYGKMSGTSVSAPYVAGVCCLICEKYTNLSPRKIREILVASCRKNAKGDLILNIN